MFKLICNLFGHKINRNRVWHDSLNYRTTCRRCGTPLIKENGFWKPFSTELHANKDRKPHPSFEE